MLGQLGIGPNEFLSHVSVNVAMIIVYKAGTEQLL